MSRDQALPAEIATRVVQGHGGRYGRSGALYSPELVVTLRGELTAAADAVGELGEGERQQWQGFPDVGVGDQSSHQVFSDRDAGQLGRALDHGPEGLAAQWPQRVGTGGQHRQVGVEQELVKERRPAPSGHRRRVGTGQDRGQCPPARFAGHRGQ